MEQLFNTFGSAKDLGSAAAVIVGVFTIIRLLIRSLTGSVSIREQTLQQLFIKILEQSSLATTQTKEATEQARQLTELLVKMEGSIEKHTEVMQKQAETNARIFEILVNVLRNSDLKIPAAFEPSVAQSGENGK